MKKFFRWINLHKGEFIAILLILSVSAFLRLYRIDEYMTFLGDEGRDVLMIKRILVEHDFPLLGPPMSVGNLYLGPLYYYMMASFMAISWLNPVAAAVMVGLIGVATVLLIYYLAREWFGVMGAILAASSYALSNIVITYSRSSWNPNPLPFFSLLLIIGIYEVYKRRNFLWLILSGGAAAFAIQMHYLGLLLLPTLLALLIFALFYLKRDKKNVLLGSLGSLFLFLFLMSPLLIFDIKHHFVNWRAFNELFFGEGSAVRATLVDILIRIPSIYSQSLIGRYLAGENFWASMIFSIVVLVPVFFFLYLKIIKDKLQLPLLILVTWFLVGLLGLSFYSRDIYDHYLNIINPIPFILLAGFVSLLKKNLQVIVALFLLLIVSLLNLPRNPLLNAPNNQLYRTQEVARYVIEKADGREFNFALIAERNYDAAYQFYLNQFGANPKILPFEKTNQLFVVCEDKICNPVGHPKHEIAAFGWTKIEQESEILGLKVYKLVHNPDEDKFNLDKK